MRPQDPNAPPSPYTAMLDALLQRYGPEVAEFAREEWKRAKNARWRYDESKKQATVAAQRAARIANRKGRTE